MTEGVEQQMNMDVNCEFPFVICKSCTRAFDVDDLRNRFGNTTIVAEKIDKNGLTTDLQITGECHYCFEKNVYDMKTDYHWAQSDREKGRMMFEMQRDAFRRREMRMADENTLLIMSLIRANLEKNRLRKELKKLSDSIALSPNVHQGPNSNPAENRRPAKSFQNPNKSILN